MEGFAAGCLSAWWMNLGKQIHALPLTAGKTSWQPSGRCPADTSGTPGQLSCEQSFWWHGYHNTVRAPAVTAGRGHDSDALLAVCGLL